MSTPGCLRDLGVPPPALGRHDLVVRDVGPVLPMPSDTILVCTSGTYWQYSNFHEEKLRYFEQRDGFEPGQLNELRRKCLICGAPAEERTRLNWVLELNECDDESKGFREWVAWTRGRCFRSPGESYDTFSRETGLVLVVYSSAELARFYGSDDDA